jgi:hypothetical protein
MTNYLPDPGCKYGYTTEQLRLILADRFEEFGDWMYGQTMTLCPEHGVVVYPWDLGRFIAGRPIVD